MATFTAIRNKKQAPSTMLNVLNYVAQEKKTRWGDAQLVTGHNCVPQSSFIEMQTTKNRFHKSGGRLFYHFVQSFSADDNITPQEVNAIGLEFAQQQFPNFEVVVATHVDTNHLHNHFVVNSVSFKDGHKLHQSPDDPLMHRKVNDEICLAHGLHALAELYYDTYESMSYEQKTQALTKRAIIYLPYGYDESNQYNVFYLMHGGWSNETTTLGTPDNPSFFKNVIDNAIEAGEFDLVQ